MGPSIVLMEDAKRTVLNELSIQEDGTSFLERLPELPKALDERRYLLYKEPVKRGFWDHIPYIGAVLSYPE